MRLYFDSAYIAKCYLNEPGAEAVRDLAQTALGVTSSSLCIAELACVLHRHLREGSLTQQNAEMLGNLFLEDLRNEVWAVLPVSDGILHQVERFIRRLPPTVFLRSGDAIHLVSAAEAGFSEIWTNDRHMLAAAPYFGITGRSVAV